MKIPSVNIHIGAGGWNNREAQFRAFRRFCSRHDRELRRVRRYLHKQGWTVDFGIGDPGENIVVMSFAFPADVVDLAATFGFQLEWTIYKQM
ncbi:hypothetical protein YTPLAS18_28270 [Nitrospira sp.]|nr:hypothetical protein YTPLAS18_28270 [Nitrospira sp.]